MALDRYRFTLNGTVIVRTPEEWENIELTIERNDDLNITVIRFTSELTFIEDGYGFIFNEYETDYNNTIDVLVERLRDASEDYEEQFKGKILLSQVVFNLDKKTVRVAIEDASFFSIIDNRKNVQAILDSEFTINGVKISPMSFSDMDFFRANGIYTGALADRNVYEVKEALDFLVRFMTDDEIKGVKSDYLSDTSNFNDGLLYVMTGKELRLKDQDAPDISFEDLFKNLRRTHNLSFAFELDSNGDTIMRIEEQEFFFEQIEAITIRDIIDLELSTDKQRIYSHLELGNETSTTGNFPSDVRFFVFVKEQYAIQGKSIVDRALDLTNDFITDTNVFMDIVENNNDEFDDNILLLQGEAGGVLALQFASPVIHYNTGFKNSEIVNRFLNGIPNSVAKFLTADSTKCLIGADGQSLVSVPTSFTAAQLLYTDESAPFFDSGNNYVSGVDINGDLSYYLIPFSDTYGFESNNDFQIAFQRKTVFVDPDDANDAFLNIVINTVRLANNFITVLETITETRDYLLNSNNELEVVGVGVLNSNIVSIDKQVSFDALLGEKIAVSINITIQNPNSLDAFTMNFLDTSEFACLGSQEDGGVFQVIEPEDYRAQLYKFKKNVPLSQIGAIRNKPFQKIRINQGSNPLEDRSAWVKRVSLNLETSEATFELIT